MEIGSMHGDVAVSAAGEVYISVEGSVRQRFAILGPNPGLQVYAPDGRFLRNVPGALIDAFLPPHAGVPTQPHLRIGRAADCGFAGASRPLCNFELREPFGPRQIWSGGSTIGEATRCFGYMSWQSSLRLFQVCTM
jgi:hypothetical protein